MFLSGFNAAPAPPAPAPVPAEPIDVNQVAQQLQRLLNGVKLGGHPSDRNLKPKPKPKPNPANDPKPSNGGKPISSKPKPLKPTSTGLFTGSRGFQYKALTSKPTDTKVSYVRVYRNPTNNNFWFYMYLMSNGDKWDEQDLSECSEDDNDQEMCLLPPPQSGDEGFYEVITCPETDTDCHSDITTATSSTISRRGASTAVKTAAVLAAISLMMQFVAQSTIHFDSLGNAFSNTQLCIHICCCLVGQVCHRECQSDQRNCLVDV